MLKAIERLSSLLETSLEKLEDLGHGIEERIRCAEECNIRHIQYFQEIADSCDLSFVVAMRPNSGSLDTIG